MTDELQFGATYDKTKIAVLREAIDRADNLATVQAQLITTQEHLISDLKLQIVDLRSRIKTLESEASELRTALSYD
jgi:hypothetical protein